MRHEDQIQYPPLTVHLRDGTFAVIRPLRREDGAALGDFYEAVPREDFRFYCPHDLNREMAARNAAEALSPHQVVLILETPEGRIGGYAWYRWHGDEAEKSAFGICIARPLQGVGAGRALMIRLLEIARHIGPPVMQLTVQQANPGAVSLYKQMGFRVVREQMRAAQPHRGFAAEPEYVMEQRTR